MKKIKHVLTSFLFLMILGLSLGSHSEPTYAQQKKRDNLDLPSCINPPAPPSHCRPGDRCVEGQTPAGCNYSYCERSDGSFYQDHIDPNCPDPSEG